MVIFYSYVKLPEGTFNKNWDFSRKDGGAQNFCRPPALNLAWKVGFTAGLEACGRQHWTQAYNMPGPGQI